jgi:peroxiredoxin
MNPGRRPTLLITLVFLALLFLTVFFVLSKGGFFGDDSSRRADIDRTEKKEPSHVKPKDIQGEKTGLKDYRIEDAYFHHARIHRFEKRQQAHLILKDMNGKKVRLKDYRGKVILLNFWATWCGPCVEEIPYLEKLHRHFKNDDFILLAVSLREKKETVKEFIDESNMTFRVLLDTEGKAISSYGIWSIPATYIIDKRGFLAGKAIGLREWDGKEVKELIASLMKE